MRKSRFTEEQIIAILREQEAGGRTADVCRRHRDLPADGRRKESIMWTYQTEIDVAAEPQALWALFADVAGWPKWNAGIETIELRGPFASGSEFAMKPPGMDAFVTTLADVREGQSFTDVTVIDGTTVRVFHGLAPLGDGRTRVTYRAEVTGPAADEIGPMATGDFDDVLAALKRTAEG